MTDWAEWYEKNLSGVYDSVKPKWRQVVDAVAERENVSPNSIIEGGRELSSLNPRKFCYYVLRRAQELGLEHTYTYTKLGQWFGRDHSTIHRVTKHTRENTNYELEYRTFLILKHVWSECYVSFHDGEIIILEAA